MVLHLWGVKRLLWGIPPNNTIIFIQSMSPDYTMSRTLDVHDIITLTLHANDDKLSNRTALQKLIYFETLKLKQLKKITYRNHFYGPFSYQVASALDDLVAFSYLSEQVSSIYDYESYHYELTKSGKKYVDEVKGEFTDNFEIIKDIVDTCNNHCNLQASPLSYSAKAHYILANGGRDQYTIKDVQDTAKDFEWEISEDDVKKGLDLLEKLNLARST